MNKDDIAGLVEELHALYVWPQFVADHHADVLLPRQTKGLYDVGKLADKAADALTTLSAENERMKAALLECIDVMGPMAKYPKVNPWLIQAKAALGGGNG